MWPGTLSPNNLGNKAAANLRLIKIRKRCTKGNSLKPLFGPTKSRVRPCRPWTRICQAQISFRRAVPPSPTRAPGRRGIAPMPRELRLDPSKRDACYFLAGYHHNKSPPWPSRPSSQSLLHSRESTPDGRAPITQYDCNDRLTSIPKLGRSIMGNNESHYYPF